MTPEQRKEIKEAAERLQRSVALTSGRATRRWKRAFVEFKSLCTTTAVLELIAEIERLETWVEGLQTTSIAWSVKTEPAAQPPQGAEPERLIAHEVATLKRQVLSLMERHEAMALLSPWMVLRLIATIEQGCPDLARATGAAEAQSMTDAEINSEVKNAQARIADLGLEYAKAWRWRFRMGIETETDKSILAELNARRAALPLLQRRNTK